MNKKALVIFSGGQDSTTCLYWAKKNFSEIFTITFNYGQRHHVELEQARKICDVAQVPFHLVPVNSLSFLGKNSLTDSSVKIENDGGLNNLPNTFVPGRNALFLTLATAYAATLGINDLVIGTCETDYSGYPDCRNHFINAMETAMSLAVDQSIKIHRPLMWLNKAETFSMADHLNCLREVIELSHTCYEGDHRTRHVWGYGCAHCPACTLRKKGFEEFKTLKKEEVTQNA